MRADSTRNDDTRTTEALTALVLSVLLLTSAVAPALGYQPTEESRLRSDVVADDTTRDVWTQESHSADHPAMLSGAEVTTLDESGGDAPRRNGTAGNGSIPPNATTTKVTLVTGQTVTVVETENRTRYRVNSDVAMHQISTSKGTYVFPDGVDFDTFDRDLFNVDLLIRQNLTDEETDSIPVIVSQKQQKRYSANGGDRSVDVLDAVGGTSKTRTLKNIGAAAGRVSKSHAANAYRTLADSNEVERVSLDVKYKVTLDDAPSIVSAEKARQKYGVTGEDVKVAVIDTGIDETHPDIDDAVVLEKDFTGEGTTEDLYGHGTHVAGIIAGDGSASNGTYTGIAPDAELYNIRVLGEGGYGYTSDIIAGMEYAVDNNADILSMSLGGTPEGLRSNDPYTEAVNYAYNHGVPVVVSAGNSGEYGYGTVGSPGVTKHAITVGATDKSGGVTGFSSRGPTPYGLYMKPDLVAPGASIVSARASGTSMGDTVNEYYTTASGTSMSAPVVSGTAALMLDKHPKWTPKRVKSILTTTADPLSTDVNEYKQGAGMVNATDAVDSDIVVTPGTIDFGTYANSTNASRVVTVQNLGNSTVTLNVTAAASSITGDTGDVSVNRSQITLAGGDTAHLNLTVNTNTSAGLYSGRLSFDDDQYTAIFGYARAHTVTVEKSGLNGTSTEYDPVWLFADKDGKFKTSGFRGLDFLENGTTTYYLLSNGTYNIISDGFNENNDQSVLVSREVSVSSNTNVTLNESDTVRYELNTSGPTEAHGPLFNKTVEVQFGKSTTSNGWYGGSLLQYDENESLGSRTVRFSTDDRLNVSVEHILIPQTDVGNTASYDASTVYHLIHSTTGVSSGRTFDVVRDQLAAKNTSYYRTRPSQSYRTALYATNTKWTSSPGFAFPASIGDRRNQTIYVSPDTGRYSQIVYQSYEWGLYGTTNVYESGERVDSDMNRHPYSGNLTGWDISSGSLNFTAVPQSSQETGARMYDDWESDDTLEVRLNGTTELTADDLWGSVIVGDNGLYDPIPVNSGQRVSVELQADNPRMPLSTRTVTTFETTYVPGEDNTPPLISLVKVVGMSHNSTAPIDPITVRFTVRNQSEIDVSNVSTWLAPADVRTVPFENRTGWSEASITRVDADTFEATLAPSDLSEYFGQVNLALGVTEDNGDTVEVTTFDAFRGIDSAEPRISVQSSPSSWVSYRNPATITVERTELNPNATKLAIENNSTGTVVYERDLSSDSSTVQTTVDWNATDASGTPVASGKYDVVVRSTDTQGNENEASKTVLVDHTEPTTNLTALGTVDDPSSVVTPVYTNGTVNFEATANGTPGGARNVTFVLSAEFTNFDVPVSADSSDGGTNWSAVGDFSDLSDDGNYTVAVSAVDPAGNRNLTVTGTTVVLDRDAPDLGATVEQVDQNTGEVTVTSDEPLRSDSVTATVTNPAGNDEAVSLTRNESADGYEWNGTFAIDGDGKYDVTASGADQTGNVGTTNSTAEIRTVSTNENKTVTVVLEKSNLFVRFRTNETGINSTVTLTESRSALAPLSRNLAGLNFLNGELGKNLTEHLDNATIGIPVDETRLPGKADAEEVTISYYDQSNGNWEVQNTTVRKLTVDNETDTYWVANVTHFSTYGAVVDDDQPPSLDAQSPDGTTLDWGTTHERVTFNYSDDISGVNASAVELYFDGQLVTDKNATNVTGEYATYNATGLSSGEYTAKVVVEDEAGNKKNYTTTFTIETDSTPPQVVDATPADGTTLPAGTENVTLNVSFDDSQSGLDPSTAKVVYDDKITFSGSYLVSGNTVSFNASGLTDGSTHTLTVEIADNEGNLQTKTIQFSVAAKSSGGGGSSSSGGGGGGGGDPPEPPVEVTLTDVTASSVSAVIRSARAGAPGELAPEGGISAGDLTVREIAIRPKSREATSKLVADATVTGTVPDGASAPDVPTLGYLEVSTTHISDAELKSVGVTFEVDAAVVDSPKNVALYRWDGSAWTKVKTKLANKGGGTYRFKASASTTGTFAVGATTASFEVSEASLGSSSVGPDEEVTVSATVENVGSGAGTYTAELTVDGEVVATKSVTLGAGEQTTVEFTRTFAAGEHAVAIGSAEAGTLAVGAAATTTEGAIDDEENQQTKQAGKDSNSGSGIPGFGIPAALAAFAVAALLARRRGS